MEPIVLHEVFNRDDFFKSYKLRLQLHFRKTLRQSFWFTIVAVVFFVLGFVLQKPGYEFNLFFIIGIILTVAILFIFWWIWRWKRIFFKRLREEADHFEQIQAEVMFVFSDESVTYQDKEKKVEFEWSMFTGYSFFQGYLFLKVKNSFLTSYAFAEAKIEPTLYKSIINLVQTKVPYISLKK